MIHMGTVELITDRLLLRKFSICDSAMSYKNWTSDEKVTKFLRWKTHKNIKQTENIIANWNDKYSDKTFYQWAIVFRNTPSLGPIGTISVNKYDDNINMVHLGFCIGSAWWNTGITSEALYEIIRFMFEEVKVNRIESWHDPENIYSGKAMLKCGMKYEGTLRQGDYNNQGIVDACEYAIIAKDYFEKY